MKHENKTRNKLIACAMCAVMLGATLFGTPWFSVLADDTTTNTESTAGQSYGAWSDQLVTNGSFEAGYVGKEVYGWHKTAFNTSDAKDTTDANGYCSHFTLTTEQENGNKVAALTKNSNGRVAVTSEKTPVTSGQEYRLSFDYKTASLTLNEGTYYGIRLYVEEWNGEDVNVPISNTTTHYFVDNTYNNEWSTGTVQFKTATETTHVVIYLWMGGTANVSATVYFDNVLLEENDDYKVFNGSFDDVTYLADGGREDGTAGPIGWTMVGTTNNKSAARQTAYNDSFSATTTEVDGRGKVALLQFEKTGYAMLHSSFIPVEGEKTCNLSVDCKLIMNGVNDEARGFNVGLFFTLSCYDSNGTLLQDSISSNLGTDTGADWKKLQGTITTAPGTAYVKIGLPVHFAATESAYGDDLDTASQFQLYYDNVVLDVNDELLGYTKVSTGDYGQITATTDYTNNYAIRKLHGGVGYEDAIQLYVAKEGGITGGVTFYSEPIEVIAGSTYAIDFDYKIEGVENESFYGADVVIRYRNASGEYIVSSTTNYGTDAGEATEIRFNNANGKANTEGWVDYVKTTFTAPTDAAKMQIGFVIGGGTAGVNPDLKQSFANISVALNTDSAHWTEYEYNKTTSDLLFKLTERGNAYSNDTDIDVLDLVMMKKYAADATLITDENKDTVLGVTDMNVNTLINNADIELLHWKLLGVDTEAKAALVQGYNFYQ